MVRYKRYRRRGYRRNSTNIIKMKFQSFMDLSTQDGTMQIISISAGGKNLLDRLPAQFAAYKYYKIGNISVKLVPASTLPVDPTGLSYEVGEPGVDPRDQLTPGMMRITNGEDVFEDLSGLDATAQHLLYNNMMLDPRWFKWMLQTGVKRHATPRYWQIGQLHQDKWPGCDLNIPLRDTSQEGSPIVNTESVSFYSERNLTTTPEGTYNPATIKNFDRWPNSMSYGFFQTGHRGVLGWLPTDGHQGGQPWIASPPEIEVMKIILPPAYKTKYYYRAYISETVYFREPIVMSSSVLRPLDVFHTADPNRILYPLDPDTVGSSSILDSATGGNYGDD